MKFTDVCIFTENVIKLAEFYEKIFNVKADKDKIHTVLELDDLSITFYDRKHAESLMKFDFSESGHGMNYIGFNVDNVDDEYIRLKKLGILNMSEPTLWPWGAKSFNLSDIEGNRIMFRSYSEE